MGALEVLKELYDEEMDKVFANSGNYLMSIPRKGCEKEWENHNYRADVLKKLIEDLEPLKTE